MKDVLQIVPRFSPAISGVGDYASLLADELARAHGWRTRFIVTDVNWPGPQLLDRFCVERLDRRDAGRLVEVLERFAAPGIPVFLHYVGYGYHKRGCPIWLVHGLERWRRKLEGRHLVVMFHELSAFGPVWTSSFWLSLLQRHLTARVARCADACVTPMINYAVELSRLAPRHSEDIAVTPVFSTMGEPKELSRLSERKPWLVLFGGGAWTTAAVTRQAVLLDRACVALKCDRIIAIGARGKLTWSGRSTFEETGVLPPAEVSAILRQARAGYLGYFSGYLGKSTIFAAYCAHGLLPLFPEHNASEADGVWQGEHYLTVDDLQTDTAPVGFQQVTENVRRWYAGHTLAHTAGVIARALEG